MTITWQHINITALVAIALHVGIGLWIGALSTSAPAMAEPPPAPLRVNLLAAVAETTTNTAPEKPPIKPVPKPPVTPPKPEPKPLLKPKPVPTPEPISKPAPKLEPIIEEIVPVPVSEPTPPPEQPTPELDVAEEVAPPPADTPLGAAATAEYERLLVAWLEKHKKYPIRAKRMRIEGEGMLRILIDRTGRAHEITLEQRTGNRLLDKAAIEMAKRATPFPPIPEFDSRQEMEFIVPVAFALR